MSKEQYAFNLDELKSFISQITAKKLKETLIEDFNSTYELNIDILSPRSLYQAAESIQMRVKKQISFESRLSKARLMNQWHLGEKTLLFCVLIYYLTLNKISIQSITENDLLPLKKIFLTKDISLLHFQAKHLLSKTMLKKYEWKQEDIELLQDIMMSKKGDFLRNDKCFRWKEVSYDIFRQSNTGEFYSAKECRQKWINHLNPRLVKATWSHKEDLELFMAIKQVGCKWAMISKKTGGLRTEHMIKNRANAIAKKFFKKKIKKIEKNHITLVIEALRNQGLHISQESKTDSSLQIDQIEKEEASDISYGVRDDAKMEIEDQSLQFGSKQASLLEYDDSYSRLVLVQNMEDQWQYNEEVHSFDLFAPHAFKYHEDLSNYFQ